MKILSVKSLALPDVKVIRFSRFTDERGYFTEPFRKSDWESCADLKTYSPIDFVQVNESFSKKGVCRGLHFQWNPFMGKLVRTVYGHMYDLVLDIRKGSPTVGKIIGYDMPTSTSENYGEWIWVPPGFAHGNFFTDDSKIEYLCSGEYSPGCEAGVSPLDEGLDWSLCDAEVASLFQNTVKKSGILSEKDRSGLSLSSWLSDKRADNFIYGQC